MMYYPTYWLVSWSVPQVWLSLVVIAKLTTCAKEQAVHWPTSVILLHRRGMQP